MRRSSNSERGSDGLFPLRWAVILTIAVAIGLGTGVLGGAVTGIGTAVAVTGLLANILGGDNANDIDQQSLNERTQAEARVPRASAAEGPR
jgi:hypothetical protein